VKFSFFSFFSEKRKQEQQSYAMEGGGGCMWWENFFSPKAFEICFFQNFKNPPLLQTSEIHAPGQDTMQFLSSFLVL
jgi:hypothetical protein